ncbi:MAG: PDZ domain-containing protein [Aggregatilineales bacterium]
MDAGHLVRLWLVTLVILASLSLSAPARAEERLPAAPYDPVALAQRFLGYAGEPALVDLPPVYALGDRSAFWASRASASEPTAIEAALVARAGAVYLWVEEGLPFDAQRMEEMAAQLSLAFDLLRRRENYAQPLRLPGAGPISDPTDLLPLPDIDGDGRFHIVFAAELSEDRDAYYNPIHSLPRALAPGGFSHERETFFVNASLFADTPLHDPVFYNAIVAQYVGLVLSHNNPHGAPWLAGALNLALRLGLQGLAVSPAEINAFFAAPETPLIQPPALTNRAAATGAQGLFLSYFIQRYGPAAFADLALEPGAGLAAIDAVLARRGLIDPATGAPVTARDAFADFVIANLVNAFFGDGRYLHRRTELSFGQVAQSMPVESLRGDLPGMFTVPQFGTRYYRYTAPDRVVVEVVFNGAASTPRLPMPPRSSEDGFYWSGNGPARNPTLTRAFDLSGVSEAQLTFDVWYDLLNNWHFGYISASTDGGRTWTALEPAGTPPAANRHGLAYGPGFTGVSSHTGPRPFPILGVVILADGMTLGEVVADGPADQAGLRPGDVVLGHNELEWQGAPNVLGLLANYDPGDTLDLLIERGGERMSIPVVLGEHPTRIRMPEARWLPASIDLTPYAGGEVLLRFETVSLPGHNDRGMAVDNIVIEAIGFSDRADEHGDGWTLSGWEAVNNVVAQPWLVQVITTGTETRPPRVRRLIDGQTASAEGVWRIALDRGETLLIAVSAVSERTDQPGAFSLTLRAD